MSRDSGINANSRSGANGTAQISTLMGDRLDSDLIQLPTKLIDPNQYLARGCGLNTDNKFITIGRGGLPQNPLVAIAHNSVLADFDASMAENNKQQIHPLPPQSKPIIEAQSWSIDADGKVELIALTDSTLKQQLNCLK